MRLIDIDELRHDFKVAEFCDKCVRANKWDCDKQMYSVRDICGLLDDSEIVDVPQVVHAQWIEEPDRYHHWHCSACGFVEGIVSRFYHYCPNCGAKIGGENDETDRC